jgi:predicted nuclease of predicted toxin-antitoxin system
MKLLFDQNLSPRLATQLADLYPNSNHVYPLGLDRVPDHEVYEYARRGRFFLVTKDADFSDLCVARFSTEGDLDSSRQLHDRYG